MSTRLLFFFLFGMATVLNSRLQAQSDQVRSVAITPDAKVAFSFNPAEKKVIKWMTKFRWPIASVAEDDELARLSVAPDQTLAVATWDEIKLYDAEMRPTWSTRGKGFISKTGKWVVAYRQDTLCLLDAGSGQVKHQQHIGKINTLGERVWAPKNFADASLRLVVVNDEKSEVRVVDITTAEIVYKKEKLKKLQAVAIDPSGTYLAIGFDENKVDIIDLRTKKEFTSFTTLGKKVLTDISFDDDARFVNTLSIEGVDFWYIEEKQPRVRSSATVARYTKYVDPVTGNIVGGQRDLLFAPYGFASAGSGANFVFYSNQKTPYLFVPPIGYVVPPAYLDIIGKPVRWQIEKTDWWVVNTINTKGDIEGGMIQTAGGQVIESGLGSEVETTVHRSGMSDEEVFLQYKVNGKLHLRSVKSGRLVTLPYDRISYSPQNKLNKVEKDKLVGFVDENFREVVPCRYEKGLSSASDFAAVYKNGLWGIVSRQGTEVVPCEYQDIEYSSPWQNNDYPLPAKKNGKWGFLNKEGKVAIAFQFDKADKFSEGRNPTSAPVEKETKSFRIDLSGNKTSD